MDIFEALEKAIENEKAAHAYYRKCAEEAEDPQTRAIFETLAEDELRHQKVLKERLLAVKLRKQKSGL